MNTLVNIELARLLKEKGFNSPTCSYRQKSAVIGDETILPLVTRKGAFDWNNYPSGVPFYSIPTIEQVVMWLHEKHGIYVELNTYEEAELACLTKLIEIAEAL